MGWPHDQVGTGFSFIPLCKVMMGRPMRKRAAPRLQMSVWMLLRAVAVFGVSFQAHFSAYKSLCCPLKQWSGPTMSMRPSWRISSIASS